MNVAIIMPTLNRPAKLKKNLGDMLLQPLPAEVERLTVVLAIQKDDKHTLAVAGQLANLWADSDTDIFIVLRENGTNCVQGFNAGYEFARGLADWYVLGSDDQVYGKNWLQEALDVAIVTKAQVIGLNDLHTNIEHYAPHYMVSSDFIEQHMGGEFVPSEYQSWWFDREICERARKVKLYAPALRATVEHCHPDWATAAMDETYAAAWPQHDLDRQLYERRRLSYA